MTVSVDSERARDWRDLEILAYAEAGHPAWILSNWFGVPAAYVEDLIDAAEDADATTSTRSVSTHQHEE